MNTHIMKKPAVQIKSIQYKGKTHLALYFEYDTTLKNLIKNSAGAKWSWEKNCWHIAYSPENLDRLLEILKGNAIVSVGLPANLVLAAANECDHKKLIEFSRWMEHKRYSPSTIKTYCGLLLVFIRYIKPKDVQEAGNEDVVRFTKEYILANGLSSSYQNQAVNALKLFFREIMKSEIETNKIERPWREHKLPNVLSKEEVKAILQAPSNLKHRAMLSLIYACGLRRSEVLNLKLADVDSKRGLLLIRNAKGRKDRVTPLSEKIIQLLREYYTAFKPKKYLFEGQLSETQYNARSLQMVLKHSLKKAGIKKPVTLHWLRHSYATHMLESGVDLRYIQEILGHNSSKTTEIYTHVTFRNIQNIKSPFDEL